MLFINDDGGLTTTGYVLTAIAVFLLLIIISILTGRGKKLGIKQIAFSSVALALAVTASMIKIIHLPMGGSVTLLSMLFVTLIGYWYGPAAGLIGGVAYGLLKMILGAYIISFPQMMVDYLFAYGALGISGFFSNRKNGLRIGYIAAIVGRFFFSVLSGVIFFGMYAPEGTSPFVYSVLYNGSYIFTEGIITVIVLSIPAVKKAMIAVRKQALA